MSAVERVNLLRSMGRFAAAEAEARKALVTDPEDSEMLALLAAVLFQADRLDAGLECAEAACAADPGNEYPHRVRAMLLSRLGWHQRAVAAAELAVTLDPEFASAANIHADVLLHARRWEDALRAARRAASLDPDCALARSMIARAHHGLGDRAAAEEAFREVLRIDPAYDTAHLALALFATDSDRPIDGLAGLVTTGALNPSFELIPSVVKNLGTVAFRLWPLLALGAALAASVSARIAAVTTLLLVTAILGWGYRRLPPGSRTVLAAALRTSRRLIAAYLHLGICVLLLTGVLLTGNRTLAAYTFLALVVPVLALGLTEMAEAKLAGLRRRWRAR